MPAGRALRFGHEFLQRLADPGAQSAADCCVRAAPMIRASGGICPSQNRRNSAGRILRRARSPVPPKITRSKGSTGMTRETMCLSPQVDVSANAPLPEA
jgi:hypothetical protein